MGRKRELEGGHIKRQVIQQDQLGDLRYALDSKCPLIPYRYPFPLAGLPW